MKTSHLLLLLLLNCGWAAVPTVATQLESALDAREFVALRYAFALAGLVVLWPLLPGRIPRGADFLRTTLMGAVVFTVGPLFQIGGIQRSQASDASILLAVDPLVSTLGAAIFLHERIPGRRWLGFALAVAGVAVMSLWRRSAPLPGLGANLLIVLSFVTEAAWSVMGKPLIHRWGIPKVVILALAAGTLLNALLLLPAAPTHVQRFQALPPGAWASLAFLGVILTSVGYCAWYVVIREAPVSVASMTIYLQPILGTCLACWIAGEALLAGHAGGAVLILAGLIVGLCPPAAGEPVLTPARPPSQDSLIAPLPSAPAPSGPPRNSWNLSQPPK